MVIGCSGIVRHLQDAIEYVARDCLELFFGRILGPRYGFDERGAIERVNLIKYNDRDHQPIAKAWCSNTPTGTNYDIDIHWVRLWPDSLHQSIEVSGVAGMQDVRFETLYRQNPAHMTDEVL